MTGIIKIYIKEYARLEIGFWRGFGQLSHIKGAKFFAGRYFIFLELDGFTMINEGAKIFAGMQNFLHSL